MSDIERWTRHSLRRRIAVLVTALLLVVGGAVALVSYFQVLGLARELRSERLRQIGEQLEPLLARGPADLLNRLRLGARDSAVIAFVAAQGVGDRREIAARIRAAGGPGGPRAGLLLLDGAGQEILRDLPDTLSGGFGPEPEPGDLVPRDSALIGPHRRLDDTTLYYDSHAPIRLAPDSPAIGTLIRRTRMRLSATSRQTFDVLLGESTGLVIGSRATGVWTDVERAIAGPEGPIRPDTVGELGWEGRRYLTLAVPIGGTPWMLVTRTAYDTVVAPAQDYLRRALVVTLLVIAAGTVGAVLIGRRLGRPIEQIAETAERIVSGDEGQYADERAPGEVARLARAFNAMVERVSSSTRRLRDSEASHRAFVAHASEGIWRIEFVPPLGTGLSRDLQIESWFRLSPLAECNPTLARMHGIEPQAEHASIALERLFPPGEPDTRKLFAAFIDNGYRLTGAESRLNGGSDNARIFLNDLIGIVEPGGLRRIWGIRRDVTLERLMDERLAQTQRLEAVGRLAGGIAHDFNNLLTAMLGYADSLREELPPGTPQRADVEEIKSIAGRAATLTRQLLAFSRGQVLRTALIDLNEVVRSTEVLLRRVIGEDIAIRLQLAERTLSVEGDPGQLERVLMNLALNARDAMPGGGTLELRTTATELDEAYTRSRPGLVAGPYAMLVVADSGTGLSEEVRRHLFEPFFTTKPKGQGTGLGLATVYGIVRQSGGDISVYSEEGSGTTFRIFLPLKGRMRPPAAAQPAEPAVPARGAQATVLLVEDEGPVREVVRRALHAAGYQVLVARDGAEALRLAEGQPVIDLLLTDMILPGMSGRELATELRRLRPTLRTIIMSGYTGDTYPALEGLPDGVAYLEKPFALAELREKVRAELER